MLSKLPNTVKYGFCNKSFRKDEPLTSWTLLEENIILYNVLIRGESSCCNFGWLDDKYVQLVRGSSFRNDLLQNPYFNVGSICKIWEKDSWLFATYSFTYMNSKLIFRGILSMANVTLKLSTVFMFQNNMIGQGNVRYKLFLTIRTLSLIFCKVIY